ncbi:hypothetical protein P152DRAFT_393334 [Eremomyces bilateralis CBS 781.70]|uniref:EamA domain-containing protein n=1 Tax=Eremomyces bilateralis CBS 781.70 TaxID=1392243 RepID=A0A6G1G9E2_9PEZI|nr:uncharacterized protein P152DRAFT_393334 [Eremomyces bilateralis CBS 781.70]KAF1814521.1 hypothetical protein P152DRAFT_393334 [Eremomyces bilateralis CBS 781.70]
MGNGIQRVKSPFFRHSSVDPSTKILPKSTEDGNTFLNIPLTGLPRSQSPDTISNLSFDESQPNHGAWTETPEANGTRSASSGYSKSIRDKLKASWVRNKGLGLVLLAQIFGTLMNVTTRLLEIEGNNGKGFHPFQILFARMSITVVIASIYMYWVRTPHFPFGAKEVRGLLIARGIGGFFGVFGMYYSLRYLPLAEATVITFLAPSIACWACSIFINEPFTRLEQIAAGVSFIGVVLIARPTSFFFPSHNTAEIPAAGNGDVSPITTNGTAAMPSSGHEAGNYEDVTPAQRASAVGMSLLGVLGAACAYTTIRWIGKRAHPLISVNYFATWCTFVSIVMMMALPDVGFLLPSSLRDWSYLIFLGTCGFIMQFLLAAGLQYEKSSRATNMTYTQMLFALTFDKLIFGTTPGVLSLIGSSLILGSAIFVAVKKDLSVKKESERTAGNTDEEGGRLLDDMDVQMEPRAPVQEVQLRTLRV